MSLLSLALIFAGSPWVEAAKAKKAPQEIQDFGVTGIEVRSIKSLDTQVRELPLTDSRQPRWIVQKLS